MTIPAPPAPPKGAIPVLIEVNIAKPLAVAITLGGIFLITLTAFFPSAAAFSSVTTPSTDRRQSICLTECLTG